ncbi:helix-turn-helix domain-containing protein [Gordonia zhaorongruii]|uniref:helix-turn-helix domain-containing protein n=1 Tax=Gordonia zhaorongruii TaxID=2597659 RepID=UPI00104F07B3|nr:helix-turn-helix domain-containing protein [Gordonia zhaorongruii]
MEFRDVRGLTAGLRGYGVTATPYDIAGGSPGTHLGIPSPAATLIVDLRDGLDLSGPGLPGREVFRCCIAGMHMLPFTIHHDGTQVGVQLALTPGAVRRLLGVPVGALQRTAFELADLNAGLADQLHDALGSARHEDRGPVTERVVAAALGGRLDAMPTGVDADANRAWREIVRTRGRVTVSQLVEQSGWSVRYLTGLFTAEYGMGPKQAARLVRFDAARAALDAGRSASGVSADLGYSDQAHLSREFASMAGNPPRRYIAARRSEFGARHDR